MVYIYSILFFILTCICFFILRTDKKKFLYTPIFGFISVVAVVILNVFLIFPSDKITIKALNEKDASAENVYITMQNIKGKNNNVLRSKVVDGKWLDTNGGQ